MQPLNCFQLSRETRQLYLPHNMTIAAQHLENESECDCEAEWKMDG